MVKRVKISAFLLLFMGASGSAFSDGACTYREAIMALERGNTVRGMTLMQMAQRDGDNRASQFLAGKTVPVSNPAVAVKQHTNRLVGLNQVSAK